MSEVAMLDISKFDLDVNSETRREKSNESHPSGKKHRELVLLLTNPTSNKELLGRLVFDDIEYFATIKKPSLTSPASPGEIDANVFIQAIMDHGWKEGFRPKEFFQEEAKKEAAFNEAIWEDISRANSAGYKKGFENGRRDALLDMKYPNGSEETE
jgi:hypothetical protein